MNCLTKLWKGTMRSRSGAVSYTHLLTAAITAVLAARVAGNTATDFANIDKAPEERESCLLYTSISVEFWYSFSC